MLHTRRLDSIIVAGLMAAAVLAVQAASAQVTTNPYRGIYGWEKPPQGRAQLGVVAGIYTDPDQKHMWVLTRCEGDGNACLGSKVDPVLKFDMDGNVVKAFGAGMFVWPHGFFVDHEGNVWVTEGAPAGEARGAMGHKVGKGHQVFKFSPEGKVLMTLGEAGVPGDDQTHFNGPAHVFVVPQTGDIWVADGHRGGNNRIVKFDKTGKYLLQVGGGVKSATMQRGLFNDPHHIAMDSQGRLFVSDRGNNRVQIFDQQGKIISVWTQFGRPSSIAIDAQDRIYVVDGTSASPRPLTREAASATRSGNEGVNNPGYESGIRIGDARTGWITEFIPETVLTTRDGLTRGVNMEFIGIDPLGNIYAGEVEGQRLVKFVRVRK